MGKNKKKRNKVYTGAGAAVDKPIITKISAVNRTAVGQWWFDNKKIIKPIARIGLIIAVVIVIIVGIVNLF